MAKQTHSAEVSSIPQAPFPVPHGLRKNFFTFTTALMKIQFNLLMPVKRKPFSLLQSLPLLSWFSFMKAGRKYLNCKRNSGHLIELSYLQPSCGDLPAFHSNKWLFSLRHVHSGSEGGNSIPNLSSLTRSCYMVYIDIHTTHISAFWHFLKSNLTSLFPLHLT